MVLRAEPQMGPEAEAAGATVGLESRNGNTENVANLEIKGISSAELV